MFPARATAITLPTSARPWSRTTLAARAKQMRVQRIATASTGRRSSSPSSTATGRCSGSRKRTASAKPRSEAGCRKRAGSVGSAPSRCRRAGGRERPGVPREKRAKPKPFRRRQMVQRLFQVLDAKLTEIEERMAAMQNGVATASAADAERDARSLAALARLYAKLVELDERGEARRAGQQAGERQGAERRCGQTPPGSCAPP